MKSATASPTTDATPTPSRLTFAVATLALLLLCLFVYTSGVDNTFLLDDQPNLQPIADHPELSLIDRYTAYVTARFAGPTGRPVAALTFFANGTEWPTDARPYKITNIVIHMIIGVLVGLLAHGILTALKLGTGLQRRWTSLLIAAIWLLHPIQVSTTLYVVQRMTQLYTLFLLAAAALYVHIRVKLHDQFEQSGAHRISIGHGLALTAGCGGCVALAVGSKETAMVFPLLIVALDATVLSKLQWGPRSFKIFWRFFAIVLPCVLFAAYTAWTWPELGKRYVIHDFNMVERLLTQPRVLLDYVGALAIPRFGGLSLFHDDFEISRGLLAPVSTLISLGIVFGLAALAIILRQRNPVFGFAVLWFLAGHALEASILPLELYFEHRNYLPSVSLIFAVGVLALKLAEHRLVVSKLASGFIILVLTASCFQNSLAWRNALSLSAIWATEHPQSLRAQIQLSAAYRNARLYDKSPVPLTPANFSNPQSMHFVAHAAISCLAGKNPPKNWADSAIAHVNKNRVWAWLPDHISNLMTAVDHKTCDVERSDLVRVIDAHISLPIFREFVAVDYNLHHLKTSLLLSLGRLDDLVVHLEKTLSISAKPQVYLTQAQLAARLNNLETAEQAVQNGLAAIEKAPDRDVLPLVDNFHEITKEITKRRQHSSTQTADQPGVEQ